RLGSLSSWRAMKNVSTSPGAICERCTSKRGSRCCIYPFLILGFQPEMTWNRQSNRRLPTHRQETISSFIVLRALGELDCLRHVLRNGVWGSQGVTHSNGYDTISPVLWKRRSNNG